jgi:pimeloyl-ACP methyl ester carboxylesterase
VHNCEPIVHVEESGNIIGLPMVVNAIADALAPSGEFPLDLPLNQVKGLSINSKGKSGMGSQVDYVFVHGGGQGGWVWEDTIAALKLQTEGACRALALDAPGCGAKRARSKENIGSEQIAAELVADIEAAGFADVVLVGHSHAGTILPLMLKRRPGLLRRAVYVSCLVPPPGQTALGVFGSKLRGEVPGEIGWPVDPGTQDRRQFYAAMFCNDMDPRQRETFLDKLGHDQWPSRVFDDADWHYDHLGAVPATYVVCLQDQALPPQWQEVFARRVKAQRVVRIDAGHQVMNTRPHTLAETLRREAA